MSIAVVAVILAVTATLLVGTQALVERRRVAAAADAAALAAADTAAGLASGTPCGVAGRAAELHRARLTACQVAGLEAQVEVSGDALGITLSVRARAGPPADRPGAELSRRPTP